MPRRAVTSRNDRWSETYGTHDGDGNDVTWGSRCPKGNADRACAAAGTLPGSGGRRTVRMRAG